MRKRSTYRPRKALWANTMEVATQSQSRMKPTEIKLIHNSIDTALERFTKGDLPREHWQTLAEAMNVAEALMGLRICRGDDAEAIFNYAQGVLAGVAMRASRTGSWTLYAAELRALRDAVWLHKSQVLMCTLHEYTRAFNRAQAVMRGAAAGNAPKGAVVVQLPGVVA